MFNTYSFHISSESHHIHMSCQCEKQLTLHSKVMYIHEGFDRHTIFQLFVHSHHVRHKSIRKWSVKKIKIVQLIGMVECLTST